ncbi:MAG TPA: acetolactate synthase large subunit [Solirubrobacteraceae bacterium]|nr:acetolactate synthase large subunit [Solirubrobacteraceae bacterium]
MSTGAQALLRTLVDGGVRTVFTNPGTSEMHFVQALDGAPEMRAVLALFEGVATGAADGYARMAGTPGATLLHLGSGLGNGVANLHNARKGKSPIVNIVGDHATYHTQYDAQLQSDIETVARNVSPGFVRTSASTAQLGQDAAEAIAAAQGPPGQVATLILPADVSWSEGGSAAKVPERAAPPRASEETVQRLAGLIRGGKPGDTALLLGGRALRRDTLMLAGRVSTAAGTRLLAEVFPARIERGAGLPPVERLAYLAELASVQLRGIKHLILVDSKSPVSFFAYPGKASDLVPDGCEVHTLAAPDEDVLGSLDALVEALGAANAQPLLQEASRPKPPTGPLTAEKVCQAVAAAMPENAIVSDEAQTSGLTFASVSAGVPAHDVLTLTGGAIGQGLPVAVGAAVACPDRPVIALEADGSAMYTLQALWTMAREGLDVTVVLFNNRSYGILNIELQRTGAGEAGPVAKSQLDLSTPQMDFVQLALGLGVPARRVATGEDLTDALEHALAEPGPHLIETVVPSTVTGARLKVMPYALNALAKLPLPVARAIKGKLAP